MNTAYKLRSSASWFASGLGYKIERQLPEITSPIDLLSLALKSKGCFSECHFLQIGANDGETDNLIFKFIISSESRWRGVLLEPQASAFAHVPQKYAINPRIQLENSARIEFDGSADFYVSANHDLLAELSSSSLKNRVSKRTPFEKIQGNCISPETPCKKFDIISLDLLVVDTEGFDADAVILCLRSNLCPDVILFEHINVPKPKPRECFSVLESRGYELLRHGIDVIAINSAR
jgi:FkbM family methyltransferase